MRDISIRKYYTYYTKSLFLSVVLNPFVELLSSFMSRLCLQASYFLLQSSLFLNDLGYLVKWFLIKGCTRVNTFLKKGHFWLNEVFVSM